MPKLGKTMFLFEKTRTCLLVATLLGTAAASEAVSLGRIRGATIVGRPLDLSLAAILEASEDTASVCVEADVFFGDSKLPPGRVRVTAESGANAGEAVIRIRTASPVDEPVVTVYLREGCSQKNTRKYVVLADVLADSGAPAFPSPSLPAVAVTVPAAPVPRAVASVPFSGTAGSSGSGSVAARGSRSRANAETVPAAPPVPRAPSPTGALPSARLSDKLAPGSPTATKVAKSRLKLDPLDLAIERDPVLRASSDLLTVPSTDAQQRAAAQALWQALNAQPQDVMRDTQRLKSLESDLSSLMLQNKKVLQSVEDLKLDLARAQDERYSNWLVYTLGIMLALALAAVAFFWSRGQKLLMRPWWRKGGEDDDDDVNLPGKPLTGNESPGRLLATNPKGSPAKTGEPKLDIDLDLDLDVDESMFETLKFPQQPAQQGGSSRNLAPEFQSDFSSSFPGVPRTVNAEELFDVQQQADFFVSLGQYDQAVEVLQHHISDNVETSALAYLDLFDLYHRLNRKDEYEVLRKDFNKVFNAQVPEFEGYSADEQGLEAYPAALSRIEALWPTAKALELIEESIFRKPGESGDSFNLAAYRELLFLYSVAKEIVDRPPGEMDFDLDVVAPPLGIASFDAKPEMTRFATTNIQPLLADGRDSQSQSLPDLPSLIDPGSDPTLPPASPRLGLDVDLTDAFGDDAPQPVKPPSPARAKGKPRAASPPADVVEDAAISNLIEFDADSISPSASWPKDK